MSRGRRLWYTVHILFLGDFMFYDTVIFDLDGTILNTLPDLACAVNHALAAHGLPLRTTDEVRTFIGNGILKLIRRSVPEGCTEEITLSVFEAFKEFYRDNSCNLTRPYNGIPELLARLKNEGVKLAVVSNKAHFAAVDICEKYFPDIFHAVLGERESEGVPKKPAPDGVFDATKTLSANKAVYVGDSDVDIETAKNAGLPCIAVTWGFREEDLLISAGAELLAHTADELYNYIMEG